MFYFWNRNQILNILKKKMFVIANVFAKLQTVKELFRTLSKKRCFRTRINSRHVKVSQIHGKSWWANIYDVSSSFSWRFVWKMSPLVLGEILGVFITTLIADDKYRVQDCENLPLAIQMQWYEKQKNFSQFFVPFLESTWNFKYFENKVIVIANIFPELQNVKISARPLSKKHRLRKRVDSQHVKASQILAKSPGKHFYHVFASFWGKLIWKIPPPVLGEILELFVKNWLPIASILFNIARIWNSQFKCNYLKNEQIFWIFCSISGIYTKF